MSLKYLKFAIFVCLLAGFSPVRGDDKKVSVASNEVSLQLQINVKGCSCKNRCTCNKGCNCRKGCTYKGIFIPEGETRTVAPCQYGSCRGGKVTIAIADCAPPPPGCRYESSMTECCKKICDLGCTYNDIFIAEGQTEPVAPCQWATCTEGEVAVMVADCAPPPPGCRYESSMTECCKKICDLGCTYNDIFIAEGQTEPVAPCQWATCTEGEVAVMVADCGPPEEGCRYESTLAECCKKICDKGCTYDGIFIPEGDNRPIAPCQYGYCNGGKVDIVWQDCARPPPNCRYESTLEQCCKLVCDPCDELVAIAPAAP